MIIPVSFLTNKSLNVKKKRILHDFRITVALLRLNTKYHRKIHDFTNQKYYIFINELETTVYVNKPLLHTITSFSFSSKMAPFFIMAPESLSIPKVNMLLYIKYFNFNREYLHLSATHVP